jgi:hypothetical protein
MTTLRCGLTPPATTALSPISALIISVAGCGRARRHVPPSGAIVVLGAHAGVDHDPALHRAAGHVKRARARLGQQHVLLPGIGADKQVIPVDPNGHVPAEQHGQAAEHLLLGQPGLVTDDAQQPDCQPIVIGHTRHGRTRTGPATEEARRSPTGDCQADTQNARICAAITTGHQGALKIQISGDVRLAGGLGSPARESPADPVTGRNGCPPGPGP